MNHSIVCASAAKMRGFIKSREGIFQLALTTTTIGRFGCDLFLTVSIRFSCHLWCLAVFRKK